MSFKEISSNVLWCVSDSITGFPSWILPDGSIINDYKTLDSRGRPAIILHDHRVISNGIYTCQVEDDILDGRITSKRLLIAEEEGMNEVCLCYSLYVYVLLYLFIEPLLIKNYTCSLDSVLVFSDTYAVLLTATVHRSIPTNINCFTVPNTHQLIQIANSLTLIEAPNASSVTSQVSVGYLVPFSAVPQNDIKCTVRNRAASDSFTCKFKGTIASVCTLINFIFMQNLHVHVHNNMHACLCLNTLHVLFTVRFWIEHT